jgi:SAM-dependent methyltransferase
MPVDKRPISFRTSFNQVADDYHAVRPSYPPSLIKDVVSLAAIPSAGRILEIGCGTGQATIPFAERGYHMVCLDIGPALAALAEQKCRPYPNVQIHVIAFEDWPAESDAFDLVMSATAFHWIPPDIGYPKAARVLKDSGTLAIFGNEHPAQHEAFFNEVQEIYQKVVPEWGPPLTNQIIEARIEVNIASTVAAINATQLFEPVTVKTYPWTEDYTTMTYIRLLNTYSDHRNLEARKQEQLFQEIAALIEKEHGGVITKRYLSILHIAKKRASSHK